MLMRQKCSRYAAAFPAVQDTREYKLLGKMLVCIQAADGDALNAALEEYEQFGRLDPWATSMFLRLKKLGEADLT